MHDVFIRKMSEDFGGLAFKDVTNIHPLALAFVLVLGVMMLIVPRRWSVVPLLAVASFIPTFVQKIVVLGLDFNLLRVMVLFGLLRLLIKQEHLAFTFKPLDKFMVYYTISATLIYTIQFKSMGMFVNRVGFSFDTMGLYFYFRSVIRSWKDVETLIIGLVIISIPEAVLFLREKATMQNIFSIFGGVPSLTVVRQGKLRCQGPFPHPIVAGCYWAAFMPMMAALWWRKENGKLWAAVGVLASLTIVMTCTSSTPVMGVLAAIVGGILFYWRHSLRQIRWAVVGTLIVLHIVMEAPVWALIARVSAVGGSTSYFRYKLIDSAIQHFPEWFLVGTRSTAHWFWGAQDVCNHYILEAVRGGILTLTLFVSVLVLAFKGVGQWWRNCSNKFELALAWSVGVSLFAQCAQFIGVSYSGGSILVALYLPLAVIGSSTPVEMLTPKRAITSS